ncbi:MAG: GNAT family N-acetyltransferase, partial [Salinarchaeum sp.]
MASDVTAPSGYTLRDAVRADSEGMATVYDGAYPDDSGYPLQTTDAVEHKVFDDDQIRSFVIESNDGDIAATASIKSDSVYSGNAEICRLAVSPDHQGNGLARTLLEHRLAVLEDDPAVDVVFSAAVT